MNTPNKTNEEMPICPHCFYTHGIHAVECATIISARTQSEHIESMHAPLVAMLERVVDEWAQGLSYGFSKESIADITAEARALLAKAKGGAQ